MRDLILQRVRYRRLKPPWGARLIRDHPLAKGLVGCWLMQEGGGRTVCDLSGYGNHGTLTNMAFPPTVSSGWNPGKDGPALAFDGSNDYVNVGTDISLKPSTITVSAWVRRTGLGDAESWQALVNVQDWNGKKGYALYFEPETTHVKWRLLGSGTTYNLSFAVSTTDWHHYCGTFDGSSSYLYVDGVQRGKVTATLDHNNALPVVIGAYTSPSFNGNFEGFINCVRIYNRALTAQEILELYENPFGMIEWPMWWTLGPVAVGPTLKSLAGALTSSGILVRQPAVSYAGALASEGAISRQTQTPRAGTLTTSGALSRLPQKVISGTLTSAGTVLKQAQTAIAGTLTSAGALVKQGTRALAGTVTSAGGLVSQGQKVLAGTLTPAGAVSAIKSYLKALAGTLTSAGALVRLPDKPLAGTLTTAGALVGQGQKLLGGTLTSVGAVLKSTSTSLAGTLTSSGAVQATLTYLKSLAGTFTSSGALSGLAQKVLAGTLTSAGALTKSVSTSLAGALSSAGALTKQSATTLQGTLISSGTLQSTLTFLKALAGTLTSSGTLVRMTSRALTGAASFAGAISRAVSVSLAGSFSTVGVVKRLTATSLAGAVSFTGAMATVVSAISKIISILSPITTLKALESAITQTINITSEIQ